MSDRQALMETFIVQAGWGDASRAPIKGDASTRSYQRLVRDGVKSVLMNAPQSSEAPSEPDGASPAERQALGYNAIARLAGSHMEAFLTIAEQLTMRGFSAPRIIAADIGNGFALLEDFGEGDFARIIHADKSQERPLYEAAVDVLAAIYRSTFPARPQYEGVTWPVRDYDEVALLAEMGLCLNYYAPDVGRVLGDKARQDFHTVWQDAFKALDAQTYGLALRDFHAENLFWLPERSGQARVGLIDFQDALFMHPAYDLSSLLEDIRRDVDPNLFEPLKQRFCDSAGLTYDDRFKAAYAVAAAQRATKLLGFPVRADKDFGKPQYRTLLPRVKRHLQNDLAHPACDDIRRWFEHNVPEALQ